MKRYAGSIINGNGYEIKKEDRITHRLERVGIYGQTKDFVKVSE